MNRLLTVAAAVIFRHDRVLICRRAAGEKLAGCWEFPGGKIEKGESPQSCIEREIYEELGVSVHAGVVVGTSLYSYDHADIELIAVRAELSEEEYSSGFTLYVHDDFKWVNPEELGQYKMAPADLPLIEKIRA